MSAYPLPSALASQTRFVTLGGVPALVAHPDWATPRPTMIWMHGRTVSKELDNGRYLRWIRAGIAAVALDLPGHGARRDDAMQQPDRTLDVLTQMIGELDGIVEALRGQEWGGVFDLSRLGIGGMSAGGMCTLRRLCEPHGFACAAVEGTAGNLEMLYLGDRAPEQRRIVHADPARVRGLSAMSNVAGWRPLPLLALHSEADRVVPVGCMSSFVDVLRERYAIAGADASIVEMKTWAETGAPEEHNGFGRVAAEAKTMQVEFLQRALGVAG